MVKIKYGLPLEHPSSVSILESLDVLKSPICCRHRIVPSFLSRGFQVCHGGSYHGGHEEAQLDSDLVDIRLRG